MSSIHSVLPSVLRPAQATLARVLRVAAAISRPAPAASSLQAGGVGKLLLPAGQTGAGPAAVRRLLVLVPEAMIAEAEVAQRAWALAAPAGLPVVFVGLAREPEREPLVRRQLAGLAALTRDEGVAVTTRLAHEAGWLPVLVPLWKRGDLVMCFAGQLAAGGWLGLGRQTLERALLRGLQAPVYVAGLAERPLELRPRLARALTGMLSVLGPLALIAGFFWLQVRVEQAASGLGATVLLCLSVALEFVLLWLFEKMLNGL